MLKDGIVLEEGDGRLVFNQYSFCEWIKHLLTHYVGISYEEASELVDNSHLAEPVDRLTDAALLAHEDAYYWAMLLYYGNVYWLKGIPELPEDRRAYRELKKSILKKYGLKEMFDRDLPPGQEVAARPDESQKQGGRFGYQVCL